jgi:hypothetical protein
MKKRLLLCLVIALTMTVFGINTVRAAEFMLGGKPLTILGYVTQGAAYGLHNDYDTYHGFQQALTNIFLETQYRPSSDLSFYVSGRFSADWAYDFNSSNSTWKDKLFDKSRSRMYMDNQYWQVLNEAHVTWKPDKFMFRVGKQIVSWGEMDGFRIMDQINPLDGRRGMADVEFENTIIPIWLIRTDYYPQVQMSWLQDLGFEFIFNPNADFITDQNVLFGNDDGGIWNPLVRFPDPTAPPPHFVDRFGSSYYDTWKPARWSQKGFEYAFRAKGVVNGTIITLNYFYGLDNSPVFRFQPKAPGVTLASDGGVLLHFPIDAQYKRFHFAGLTASRDLPFLTFSGLGGVAPILRFEGFYAFRTTFETNTALDAYNDSDEIRAGLGIDWKIKVPLLNPKANIFISPQVYYRRLMNITPGEVWSDAQQNFVERNNWTTSLYLNTMYLNAKLVPSVFWMHDWVWDSNFYRFQVAYDWSSAWRGTIGAVFLDGNKPNYGLEPFANKDYVFFKVSYKFQ